MSFAVVENPGLRAFAQYMIQIGSKYGNISVDDVLYGRQTVRDTVFNKMAECQEAIRKEVAISSQVNSVSFCTDMTTDDVNKNSFSDFTVFWVKNWSLHHAMYKCEYFPERHTAQNIQKFIDKSLSELGLSLTDTPCTTDKGSNVVAATSAKTHVDCSCHRLNTSIDTAWKKIMFLDEGFRQLDGFCHDLVKYVNQASGIQSKLPTTLKHGGETRPWRSLTEMFSSIQKSRDALAPILRERKKEQLVARIDIDLLTEVVSFLSIFPSLFDILEYAKTATLQNCLPVYYTMYEAWQCDSSDSEALALMKREFLAAVTDKYWDSLCMLHFVATFLDPSLRGFLFVRNISDRQGFLKQVKDGIHSLASVSHGNDGITVAEPDAAVTSACVNSLVQTEEPTVKKLKADPFSWFRSATCSKGRLGNILICFVINLNSFCHHLSLMN